MSDKNQWIEAINTELENMKILNVFEPIDKIPKNSNPIIQMQKKLGS